MKNKIVRCLFLILVFSFGANMLFAQQSRKKEDKIKIPEEALMPALSNDEYMKRLKDCVEFFESLHYPPQLREYARQESKPYSSGPVYEHIGELKTLATDPDLEEVTKLPRGWFARFFNESVVLYKLVCQLEAAVPFRREEKYKDAKEKIAVVPPRLKALLKDPPKRLDKEYVKKITEENRKRRKEEYLKNAKEAMKYQETMLKKMPDAGNSEKPIKGKKKKSAKHAKEKDS